MPATVEETTATEGCREVKGQTLTFNRSADTMDVDGQQVRRYEVAAEGVVPVGRDTTLDTLQAQGQTGPRMSTLRTEGLTKSYGRRTVVRGVSIEVGSGEIVGLLGPNGAGKTTTFYMTVGLTAPDSGRVILDGDDVTSDPMYVRARKGIGYLPQEPSIFRGLTVEQNLLAIVETLKMPRAARRERVRELLAELKLTKLANAPAYGLSGGERRRVEITRALVMSPRFILLDEPFAGIDPIAVTDIQTIIFHLKARGIGVLITDHNVRETLRITDRAYIVHDGVLFRSGTPDSLANDEEVRRIYLGADFRLD